MMEKGRKEEERKRIKASQGADDLEIRQFSLKKLEIYRIGLQAS